MQIQKTTKQNNTTQNKTKTLYSTAIDAIYTYTYKWNNMLTQLHILSSPVYLVIGIDSVLVSYIYMNAYHNHDSSSFLSIEDNELIVWKNRTET